MIRYLKERGIYVLFNTNGTLLAPKKRRELIETGLDELRVSLDAAEAESVPQGPRQEHVRPHRPQCQRVHRAADGRSAQRAPRVSLWLTGLKETVDQLPDFVRLAARIGVKEVYLQRLVFDDLGRGLAREESSLFEKTQQEEEAAIAAAQELGRVARRHDRRLGRHRARRQPEAKPGRGAVVGVPAPVVADVFHRARPRAAVLHRAVLGARLRDLYARRCDAADAARDLERRRLPAIPRVRC